MPEKRRGKHGRKKEEVEDEGVAVTEGVRGKGRKEELERIARGHERKASGVKKGEGEQVRSAFRRFPRWPAVGIEGQ